MNILADENLHRGIADRLEADGHAVVHIGELSPGITDEEVLAIAVEQRALLVTHDLDFGTIVYRRGARRTGVLLLRLGAMPFDEQARLVARALAGHEPALRQAFSVLTEGRLRIRS